MYRTLPRALAAIVPVLLLSFCTSKSTPTSPTPASCSYSLSTSTLSLAAGGGPASVTVTTGASCGWTATTDRTWMTITSSASGTGSGVVNLQVAANTEADRSGTLTVGGQRVAVEQAGAVPVPCSFAVTPASASFSKDAATGGFDITAAGSCGWTVTSTASWIAFTSPTQGTGNGHVSYAVDQNRDASERRGTIAVADKTFAITQAGDASACQYSVAPVSLSACMASPGTLSTTITTTSACTWTAVVDSPWLTLSSGASGTGTSAVTLTLAPNWDAPRTGMLSLRWPTATAGQNVVVSQAGCRYAVSTTSLSAPVGGASLNFNVVQESDPMECGGPLQNACQWTATPNVPWITITTSMPQAGDNPVQFTVAPNGTGAPRTGTITVRDKTVTITQAGI